MVLYSNKRQLFPPQKLPRVMLTFVTTHLYPTWKLHCDTCKDEIMSPSMVIWVDYYANYTTIFIIVNLLE